MIPQCIREFFRFDVGPITGVVDSEKERGGGRAPLTEAGWDVGGRLASTVYDSKIHRKAKGEMRKTSKDEDPSDGGGALRQDVSRVAT